MFCKFIVFKISIVKNRHVRIDEETYNYNSYYVCFGVINVDYLYTASPTGVGNSNSYCSNGTVNLKDAIRNR